MTAGCMTDTAAASFARKGSIGVVQPRHDGAVGHGDYCRQTGRSDGVWMRDSGSRLVGAHWSWRACQPVVADPRHMPVGTKQHGLGHTRLNCGLHLCSRTNSFSVAVLAFLASSPRGRASWWFAVIQWKREKRKKNAMETMPVEQHLPVADPRAAKLSVCCTSDAPSHEIMPNHSTLASFVVQIMRGRLAPRTHTKRHKRG